MVDDDRTLTAAESLALIERQRGQLRRTIEPNAVLVYGTWGAAWFLGFTSLYLAYRSMLPLVVGGLTFFVLVVAALAITGVHFTRIFRGVVGVSSRVGTMYAWTWLVGFVSMGAMQGGLARAGLTPEQGALLGSSAPLLVVGLLYMAGGALGQERVQYVLGIWILVTNGVAVFAGVPGNYLVLTIAGGGGFLVAAAWFALRRRRSEAA